MDEKDKYVLGESCRKETEQHFNISACFLCGPDFYSIQQYNRDTVVSWRSNETVDKSNGSVNTEVLLLEN